MSDDFFAKGMTTQNEQPSELKPCPFCGTTAVELRWKGHVGCPNINCAAFTANISIEKWNTRASESSLPSPTRIKDLSDTIHFNDGMDDEPSPTMNGEEFVAECSIALGVQFTEYQKRNISRVFEIVIAEAIAEMRKENEPLRFSMRGQVEVEKENRVTIQRLQSELANRDAVIKDDCENDDAIRAIAKKYFGDKVDGDSFGVPSVVQLVEWFESSLTEARKTIEELKNDATKIAVAFQCVAIILKEPHTPSTSEMNVINQGAIIGAKYLT